MVGVKKIQDFFRKPGSRLRRMLPSKAVRFLTKGFNLLTKFYVVEMRLRDLSQLPPVQVPDGYRLASLEPGYEQHYIDVMRQSLKEKADENWFFHSFTSFREYDPKNLLVLFKEDIPVAVAAAWQTRRKGEWMGLLKNVGVIQDYQGKGLGRCISLFALHRLRDRGFSEVFLKTHDYRIRAIQLYLSLGFEPRYNLGAGKRKWKRLISQIDSQS